MESQARKYVLLSRAEQRHQQRLLLPHSPLFLDQPSSENRAVIESYIARQFLKVHQATIEHFSPYLLSTKTEESVSSAVGFNLACESEVLFLETYLNSSVEQAISEKLGQQIKRQSIVEIGNLTSTRPGSSHMLFILIAAILYKAGFEWVVFTATTHVQHILDKLNLSTFSLASADPALLPDKGASWGRYYDNHPEVMVGHLGHAMTLLTKKPVIRFMLDNYAITIDDIAQRIAR